MTCARVLQQNEIIFRALPNRNTMFGVLSIRRSRYPNHIRMQPTKKEHAAGGCAARGKGIYGGVSSYPLERLFLNLRTIVSVGFDQKNSTAQGNNGEIVRNFMPNQAHFTIFGKTDETF